MRKSKRRTAASPVEPVAGNGLLDRRALLGRGVMLAGHGIICWADSSKACFENTIDLIAKAATFLNARLSGRAAFGGVKVSLLSQRADVAARLLPRLRGLMSQHQSKVGHYSDDAETLEFVGSVDFEKLASIGTSCPDHFLDENRTADA